MSGTRASLRISVSSLRAHKRRFAGTFTAVLLGVAFLTGTLVMGDTLRGSFDTMFGDAAGGTDAVVRSADVVTVPGDSLGTREPVDTGLIEKIERVPGVAAVAPRIEGAGQLVGSDGEPVGGQGPPTVAGNWIDDARLNPYRLADGRLPERSGEVVLNRGAAEAGKLSIGDTTVLRTPDPVRVTVVGLATFGGEDGMAQVTYTGMTRADAEKYLMPEPGGAASIQVRAGPGTGQEELAESLRAVLPSGVEAITGQESAEENQEMISGQFLSLFTTLLLVFSGIVLLVATFSIHNTFAIVVAQRTRENALLRALGASRRQVVGATLAEASVVALVASAAGLLGGIGIAAGMRALFPVIGFPFPEGPLVIGALSMLLPLAVGVAVCLGSALLPAVRAGRTAPLAALRETAVDDSGASRTRSVVGTVVGLAGIGTILAGVLATPSLVLAGTGAVLALAAFVVLGPVASSYAVRLLGAPLDRLRGVSGALARRNALRSPKRTAATATALMIGVAVVSLFTVFGASLKATMDRTVSRSFAGDLAVSVPAFGGGGSGLSPGSRPPWPNSPRWARPWGSAGSGRGRRGRPSADRHRPGRARRGLRSRLRGRLVRRIRRQRHRGVAPGGRRPESADGQHGPTHLHRRPEGDLHGQGGLRAVGTRGRLRHHPRRLGPAPDAGRRHPRLRHLQGRRARRRGEGSRGEGGGAVRQPGRPDT